MVPTPNTKAIACDSVLRDGGRESTDFERARIVVMETLDYNGVVKSKHSRAFAYTLILGNDGATLHRKDDTIGEQSDIARSHRRILPTSGIGNSADGAL
jgi:hypothetical protein